MTTQLMYSIAAPIDWYVYLFSRKFIGNFWEYIKYFIRHTTTDNPTSVVVCLT